MGVRMNNQIQLAIVETLKLESWQKDIVKFILTEHPEFYGLVRHVSRSGMQRYISIYIIMDGKLVNISKIIASVLKWKLAAITNNTAIKVDGVGMDMIFHTIYCFMVYNLKDKYWYENQNGRYSQI